MRKTFKIHEPKKILYSNMSDYIYKFLDLVKIREQSDGDEETFRRLKHLQMWDVLCYLEHNTESYMYTDNYIIRIEYLEDDDGNPDTIDSTILDKYIGDCFKYPAYRVCNIVYGVDQYKNLVSKELRDVVAPDRTLVFRTLYRAIKKGVTRDQIRDLTYKINNKTLTSSDISRYTEAIGWRLM